MAKKTRKHGSAEAAADYAKDSFRGLKRSFTQIRIRSFLIAVFFELLFIALAAKLIIPTFQASIISYVTAKLPMMPTVATTAMTADLAGASSSVRMVLAAIFAIIFGFMLILSITYALTNLMIWAQISGRKITSSFSWRFAAAELVWILGWVIIFVIIANSIKQEAAASWTVALIISYAHLTTVMHIALTRHGEVWLPLGRAFSAGIGKIHHFILPYIFAGTIFIIIFSMLKAIGTLRINVTAYSVFFVVLLSLYAVWAKYYIYSFAEGLA